MELNNKKEFLNKASPSHLVVMILASLDRSCDLYEQFTYTLPKGCMEP